MTTLIVCGCGGEKLVPVEGKVVFNGEPVNSGDVVFYPIDRSKHAANQIPQGKIDGTGKYRLSTDGRPGAPLGKYKVVVVAQSQTRPPEAAVNPMGVYPLIPSDYFQESTTKLTIEVTASAQGGAYDLKIEK